MAAGAPEIMVFHPTLEEMKDFPKFISYMESKGAHKAGVAKIIPPPEFVARSNYDDLDLVIPAPIQQEVTGQQGLYTQYNIQKKPIHLRDYKRMAESRKYTTPIHEDYEDLERKYWKNVSFNPPIYGADISGSIYDPERKIWNINSLNTVLDIIEDSQGVKIEGVNTAYLYFGMWKTTFAWHTEDMDLYSINYLHFGAPKSWYAIPPEHGKRLERLAAGFYPSSFKICPNFLRHKMTLISPSLLRQYSIPVNKITQERGQFMITFPYGYHAGFNHGFNCAESTNFASKRWIDYGKRASHTCCNCQRDSVKISMDPFVKKFQPERYELWLAGKDNIHIQEVDGVKSQAQLQSQDGSKSKLSKDKKHSGQKSKGSRRQPLVNKKDSPGPKTAASPRRAKKKKDKKSNLADEQETSTNYEESDREKVVVKAGRGRPKKIKEEAVRGIEGDSAINATRMLHNVRREINMESKLLESSVQLVDVGGSLPIHNVNNSEITMDNRESVGKTEHVKESVCNTEHVRESICKTEHAMKSVCKTEHVRESVCKTEHVSQTEPLLETEPVGETQPVSINTESVCQKEPSCEKEAVFIKSEPVCQTKPWTSETSTKDDKNLTVIPTAYTAAHPTHPEQLPKWQQNFHSYATNIKSEQVLKKHKSSCMNTNSKSNSSNCSASTAANCSYVQPAVSQPVFSGIDALGEIAHQLITGSLTMPDGPPSELAPLKPTSSRQRTPSGLESDSFSDALSDASSTEKGEHGAKRKRDSEDPGVMEEWSKMLNGLWVTQPFHFEMEQSANSTTADNPPGCSVCQLFYNEKLQSLSNFHKIFQIEDEQEDSSVLRRTTVLTPESCFAFSAHNKEETDESPYIGEDGKSALLQCSLCKVQVHASCYGELGPATSNDSWQCQRCSSEFWNAECCLCNLRGGALKLTTKEGTWAHIVCAMAIPDVTFVDIHKRQPININSISPARFKLKCQYCRSFIKYSPRFGACIQCSVGKCVVSFHVTCAYAAGVIMEPSDWPYPVYSTCLRHMGHKDVVRQLPLSPLQIGQRVIAKYRNARYYYADVVHTKDQMFYHVNFEDGSYSDNLFPEDIQSHDCLRNGPPAEGEPVQVMWTDNQVYSGWYVASTKVQMVDIEFEDGVVMAIKREDVYSCDEPLPKKVKSRLSTASDRQYEDFYGCITIKGKHRHVHSRYASPGEGMSDGVDMMMSTSSETAHSTKGQPSEGHHLDMC
ncbi:lysine-specific demethylase 4A-like [Antedon mediterranea]|uniref:lysine-specific demethylase 4A-like n=1 Tax=Antedon mediterranea TaxID=105859 RepID=UPI003AF87ABA